MRLLTPVWPTGQPAIGRGPLLIFFAIAIMPLTGSGPRHRRRRT